MFNILRTEEFIEWFKEIDAIAKKDIFIAIEVLSHLGPSLGRPHVDTLKGTKVSNLKELRIRSNGRPFRIIFVFDPKRNAVLLIGGNKAQKKDFYEKIIKKAEKIYFQYLSELE